MSEKKRILIENKIKKVLINELLVEVPMEKMGPDDGMQTVFGLDSLGFTELRYQCENIFDVKISDEDFTSANFSSIRKLSELINKLSDK